MYCGINVNVHVHVHVNVLWNKWGITQVTTLPGSLKNVGYKFE